MGRRGVSRRGDAGFRKVAARAIRCGDDRGANEGAAGKGAVGGGAVGGGAVGEDAKERDDPASDGLAIPGADTRWPDPVANATADAWLILSSLGVGPIGFVVWRTARETVLSRA